MTIENIVDVQISRTSVSVSQANFDTLLFMGRHKFWTERTQIFTSLQDLVDAGVPTNSAEYLATALYFGQAVSPTSIVIGRRESTAVTLTPTVANGTTYKVTVGTDTVTPVEYTYVSDGDATATEIVDGLAALITANGDFTGLLTAVNSSDELLITQVSGTLIVNNWTDNQLAAYTSSESMGDAITAIRNENDDWYGFASYSHLQSDIEAINTALSGAKKLFGYGTGDSSALTTGITDVMAVLNLASEDRAFGIFDTEAGSVDTVSATTTYPEAAWFGDMLARQAGSATWAFKPLTGIGYDTSLTEQQKTNVLNKKGNILDRIADINVTRDGTVASGEYIDVIRGIDYIEARMEERIFQRLASTAKIPYTDTGIQIIEGDVIAVLQEAVGLRIIESFTVAVPKAADVAPADKAARLLRDVTFEAVLAGAIHKTIIRGTVTV